FGKMSLVGYCGVAPDVKIAVRELAQPIQLAFVFIAGVGGAGGQYKVQFRIMDQARVSILTPPPPPVPTTVPAGGEDKRLNFAIQLLHAFQRAGLYRVQLLVDGAPHYETTFEV